MTPVEALDRIADLFLHQHAFDSRVGHMAARIRDDFVEGIGKRHFIADADSYCAGFRLVRDVG